MLKFIKFVIICSLATSSIMALFATIYFYITIIGITCLNVPVNQKTKTCLVTGASSGIGYEISKKMIKKGWRVIGIARQTTKLEQIKSELGTSQFITYECDVSDTNNVHLVSDEIKKQGLSPTLFFLNAGTGLIETNLTKTHKETFDTNYFGIISWIDEWIQSVKELGGGTFVATSSVGIILPFPNAAGYYASKSAINTCFQSLRFHDNISRPKGR